MARKSKYVFDRLMDNEWHIPRRKNYGMQCCDCGLIHRVDFRLVTRPNGTKSVAVRARRDDKATKLARKALGIKVR
jgi:hypothetical protein